jgi:hypothetical protein
MARKEATLWMAKTGISFTNVEALSSWVATATMPAAMIQIIPEMRNIQPRIFQKADIFTYSSELLSYCIHEHPQGDYRNHPVKQVTADGTATPG